MTEDVINQIKILHTQGLGYTKISKQLNVPRSNVKYYINHEKEKTNSAKRQAKYRKTDPIKHKLMLVKFRKGKNEFNRLSRKRKTLPPKFTLEEFKEKIFKNPYCYLTGREINLENRDSYCFDHIIPKSKGGDNSLENLGLTCNDANAAKSDMLLVDFFALCKEILEHNGYIVNAVQ